MFFVLQCSTTTSHFPHNAGMLSLPALFAENVTMQVGGKENALEASLKRESALQLKIGKLETKLRSTANKVNAVNNRE